MDKNEHRETERARREKLLVEKLLSNITISAESLRAIREETKKGVAEGIVEAGQRLLTPENADLFWQSFVRAMKQNATNRAGTWLLGGFGKAFSAFMWMVVLIVALWMNIGTQGMLKIYHAYQQARGS